MEKNKKSISLRLQAVISMVPAGASLADIGCDHAYCEIELLRQKKLKRCIAADVRPGPLKTAEQNIREAGLQERVSLRLSDGFQAVEKGETDTAILSGMGGPLIFRIVKEAASRGILTPGYRLILSPQSEVPWFRLEMRDNGIQICREKMVLEDHKFYTVMECRVTPELPEHFSVETFDFPKPDRENLFLFFPENLVREGDPVLEKYLLSEEKKKVRILEALQKSGTADTCREEEIRQKLGLIKVTRKILGKDPGVE